MEKAGAVAGLAGAFAFLVEAAALPAPDSAGPPVGDIDRHFLAEAETETTLSRCLVAGAAEDSGPDGLIAVVNQYQ